MTSSASAGRARLVRPAPGCAAPARAACPQDPRSAHCESPCRHQVLRSASTSSKPSCMQCSKTSVSVMASGSKLNADAAVAVVAEHGDHGRHAGAGPEREVCVISAPAR